MPTPAGRHGRGRSALFCAAPKGSVADLYLTYKRGTLDCAFALRLCISAQLTAPLQLAGNRPERETDHLQVWRILQCSVGCATARSCGEHCIDSPEIRTHCGSIASPDVRKKRPRRRVELFSRGGIQKGWNASLDRVLKRHGHRCRERLDNLRVAGVHVATVLWWAAGRVSARGKTHDQREGNAHERDVSHALHSEPVEGAAEPTFNRITGAHRLRGMEAMRSVRTGPDVPALARGRGPAYCRLMDVASASAVRNFTRVSWCSRYAPASVVHGDGTPAFPPRAYVVKPAHLGATPDAQAAP